MKEQVNKESVYLLRYVGRKEVKIGMSKNVNPYKRIKDYGMYSIHGVEVLGVVPCLDGLEIEKTIHKEFRHKRIKGEWFNLTDEDVEFIIDKYSSYEYKKAYDMFLKNYIKKIQNIDEYDLDIETHEGFYEWCVKNIETDVKYLKADLLDEYNKCFKTEVKRKDLFNMISKYAYQNDIEIVEKRTQDYRYVIFELSNPAI